MYLLSGGYEKHKSILLIYPDGYWKGAKVKTWENRLPAQPGKEREALKSTFAPFPYPVGNSFALHISRTIVRWHPRFRAIFDSNVNFRMKSFQWRALSSPTYSTLLLVTHIGEIHGKYSWSFVFLTCLNNTISQENAANFFMLPRWD